MTKTKQVFSEMIAGHGQQFAEFKKIHDLFVQDQEKWSEEFNRLGAPILEIYQIYEDRLCSKMEGSGRGRYSTNLADKFRAEVKTYLPYFDLIGVKISG